MRVLTAVNKGPGVPVHPAGDEGCVLFSPSLLLHDAIKILETMTIEKKARTNFFMGLIFTNCNDLVIECCIYKIEIILKKLPLKK